MGWLITVGILFLLAALPLGVSVHYDKDGFWVKGIIAFLRFPVYPFPKKKNPNTQKPNKEKTELSPKKKQPAPKPAAATAASNGTIPERGGSLTDFLPLLGIILDFARFFRRKLRVRQLTFHLVLAAEDPFDLAVGYGGTSAVAAGLLQVLERTFAIDRRDVEIGCDFTAAETLVLFHLELTITLGRLAFAGFVYGIRMLIQFFKILKKRKGGASA